MHRFVVWISLLCLTSCGESLPDTPDRPVNVPESGVWLGGLDGGSWIDCERQSNQLNCSIYWQTTGELNWKQSYILCGASNPSDWMGFPNGIDFDKEVRRGGLYWAPITPQIIYRDGVIDKELSAKAAHEFSVEYGGACADSLLNDFK